MKILELNAEGKDDEGFYLILCPKEEKKLADYNCLGSFVRGIETCKHLLRGSVGPEDAQMLCLYPEEREET